MNLLKEYTGFIPRMLSVMCLFSFVNTLCTRKQYTQCAVKLYNNAFLNACAYNVQTSMSNLKVKSTIMNYYYSANYCYYINKVLLINIHCAYTYYGPLYDTISQHTK